MSKYIQLWLYALLCLSVAVAIFFLQIETMFALLFIYTILFLIGMQFSHRGLMRSIPAGPYSIRALSIFLGMLGLLTILFLGHYLVSLIGVTNFFDSMESAHRLQVLIHHLPLIVLTGLLGALAVFGYLATIHQRKFPRFVWLMMERSFILFVLVGILLISSLISDRLYTAVAPVVTGEPDILDKQAVYETFVMLDTQLNLVHRYVSQAWEDATSEDAGETLCIAPPGPFWSSEGLQLRAFPPSTLRVVDKATLLLESWQTTLEGIELYEEVEATMLESQNARTYQSSLENSEGYIVCGNRTERVIKGIETSLEHLEKARHILNTWIELNDGYSIPGDIQA